MKYILLKMDPEYFVIERGILLAIRYTCFSLQGNSYTVNLQYHATHPVSFHFLKIYFNATTCHHLAFTIFFNASSEKERV